MVISREDYNNIVMGDEGRDSPFRKRMRMMIFLSVRSPWPYSYPRVCSSSQTAQRIALVHIGPILVSQAVIECL